MQDKNVKHLEYYRVKKRNGKKAIYLKKIARDKLLISTAVCKIPRNLFLSKIFVERNCTTIQ